MSNLLTALLVFVGLLLAAAGLGRRGGKNKAETEAAVERATENAAAAEKRNEVLKNAIDVQQDIARQPDSSVRERLRRWQRPSN